MTTWERVEQSSPFAFMLGGFIMSIASMFFIIMMLHWGYAEPDTVQFKYVPNNPNPAVLVLHGHEYFLVKRTQDTSMDDLAEKCARRTDTELGVRK